jgi:hypothetical protein
MVSTVSAGISTEASTLGTGAAISTKRFAGGRDDNFLDVAVTFTFGCNPFIMLEKSVNDTAFVRVQRVRFHFSSGPFCLIGHSLGHDR